MTKKDRIKDIKLTPRQFLKLLDDEEVVVRGIRITAPSAIEIGDEIDNNDEINEQLEGDFVRVFEAWPREIEEHLMSAFLQEDNDSDADEE